MSTYTYMNTYTLMHTESQEQAAGGAGTENGRRNQSLEARSFAVAKEN
jgi:hypothetical protein